MDLLSISHILAKALGIYLAIAGVFLLVRRQKLHYLVVDFFKSEPLIVISGFFALFFGLLILFIHPVFELNWRGLVTLLFGIVPIFQGIFRLFFSEEAKDLAYKWSLGNGPYYCGIASVVVGAIVALFGFIG